MQTNMKIYDTNMIISYNVVGNNILFFDKKRKYFAHDKRDVKREIML